jgi:hypothetical protein
MIACLSDLRLSISGRTANAPGPHPAESPLGGLRGWGLFADAALPAFFGAVLAILTILAGVAWIGAGTGRRESVERDVTDEKG